METVVRRFTISRIDQRYRHSAEDVSHEGESAEVRQKEVTEKEEELREKDADALKLSSGRDRTEKPIMGRSHRMFHRRQEPQPAVLTAIVRVVATVDSNNNVIGVETLAPAFPSVPAMPTDPIPSVPAVPAFPSDLTVPAYPFPVAEQTGVPISTSLLAISTPTPEPTSLPAPTSLGFNSTISSTISSTVTSISLSTTSTSTASSSLQPSSSSSSSASSSSSSSSSPISSSSSTSTSSLSSTASKVASTSLAGGGGGPVPTASAPTETAATGTASSSGSSSPATPTVVGSVVGSIAGFALLLALLLFLIRRHKRKLRGGALQLDDNDPSERQLPASSSQQMATRSSIVPAAFMNRFSSTSKSTMDTTATGEKGFQRISGRKLPSAFSEGMTSEQFARREGTLSGSSFYTDDQGFYGGAGAAMNKEFGKEIGASGAMGTSERIMPSPARTPVLHHAGDTPQWGTSRNGGSTTLSPPASPNPAMIPRGTLGRSHPSHDGSRGSRFTEDV